MNFEKKRWRVTLECSHMGWSAGGQTRLVIDHSRSLDHMQQVTKAAEKRLNLSESDMCMWKCAPIRIKKLEDTFF